MPSYDFYCTHCGNEDIMVVAYERRDDLYSCSECGEDLTRRFPTPMIAKASHPDGTTKRFRDLKEAAKLEKEAANSKPDRKAEITREIKKLGVTTRK